MKKHYPDYTAQKDGRSYYEQEPNSEYMKRGKSIDHFVKPQAERRQRSKEDTKKPFIEPGTQCNAFQEIMSTTKIEQNGMTTYLIAKELFGPMLGFASQQETKKKQAKKPSKPIPEIPSGISGDLEPHLIGYSTVTHEGLYRQVNDDKIAIYLQQNAKWFSLYDGHGGNKCSQFLKDTLHQEFFSLNWKKDIPSALRLAFENAESKWEKKGDKSGSCALVVFIYENVCYVANLGDSRAVLASQNNSKCYQITKDHKPSNTEEQVRVTKAGGKIYQTTAITQTKQGNYDIIVGPLRVFPGRLSITRTFGDFQAKDPKQGNPNVVICQPQITSFQIDDHDMVIMGSDGVWDKIDNIQAVQLMKTIQSKGLKGQQLLKQGAQLILQESMKRGSTDNISLIVIGLNDPQLPRQPKKGNQHIKIMSALNSNTLRKKIINNKQNSGPAKIKQLDSRIQQINRNANRILQQSRR